MKPLTVTINSALNWSDRVGIQQQFTPEEVGWKVAVEWGPSEFGTGVFAKQSIKKGTVVRRGVLGVNYLPFESAEDIDAFCRRDGDSNYDAKLQYVCDYIWSFHTDAASVDNEQKSEDNKDTRTSGIWIPGCAINHSTVPNLVFVWNSEAKGIDLIARVDISEDEEIVCDYRTFGNAPRFLKDWADKNKVSLPHPDCNDFVDPSDPVVDPI